jgi:hypothetical protein
LDDLEERVEQHEGIESVDVWGSVSTCFPLRSPTPLQVPLTPANSCRSLPNPDINGLSCRLLPFFPRSPHLMAAASPALSAGVSECDLRARRAAPAVGGTSWMRLGLPPRMAETDECGERACFWMADVMAMHSDITRDTGSTATETGRLRYCMRDESRRFRRGVKVPSAVATAASMGAAGCASWSMVRAGATSLLMPARIRGTALRWPVVGCRYSSGCCQGRVRAFRAGDKLSL